MITFADPIDLDALRVRHEFLTLPDLCASVATVAALLGVSERRAALMLESLASEGFLSRALGGQYVRATAATSYRPAIRAIV